MIPARSSEQAGLPGRGEGFICGSAYEPGLISHIPVRDYHAVGLGLNW